ncbi:pentatricopeptide repeat-containing protein At4g02750-like [Selaginella moellendorffii]|uniref:pentatricopeptide repeat-containing protein At4g02750-like n=1 Tax=Selaginella moellendorffii TaxID=88036 RepID=UPI000D1CB27F|nr:pentatricopeptide repeat-containing protein At4g02750-like [Selaginella moellendorffii]|eukprot:XP_024545467.1 pentatricopeptide repeat-containing protein At4g02750-like [Selaginella moellendorffii]
MRQALHFMSQASVANPPLRHREDLERELAPLLRQCIKTRDLSQGKQIHKRIVELSLEGSRFLGHLLIQMYGKCGCIAEAQRAFASIHTQNIYSWNLIIVAFLENGNLQSAQDLFDRRPQFSVIGSNAMISAYAQNGHLRKAKEIFDSMPDRDTVSWNAMITAYSQNGDILSAKRIFHSMKERDVVSWNTMVAAYAQSGHGRDAIRTFRTMELEGLRPDHVTVLCALAACAETRLLSEGRQMHVRAGQFWTETKVGNAVMDMYGKCGAVGEARLVFNSLPVRDVVAWTTLLVAYASTGDLGQARRVFDEMPDKNLVSWNCMIMSYSQAGHFQDVLEIFGLMLRRNVVPDEGTFVTVIDACANAGALVEGEAIHKVAIQHCTVNGQRLVNGLRSTLGLKIGNALLSLYTKCSRMETALEIFEQMPVRSVISWTTLISAYAQQGHGRESLKILRKMDLEGIPPNEVTFVSALDACVAVSALPEGRQLHRRSVDTGIFAVDAKVGNAIINVYGKCGRLDSALWVFRDIPRRNRISWNALLAAYAQNGHCRETLDLLALMTLEGIQPDQITFTSVLSICAHGGLRRECWSQFVAVRSDYRITHDVTHYVCIVDLLGRLGYLDEAEELIAAMPFEPTVIVWTTLLAACRIHKNTELAVNAAVQAIALERGDPAGLYILLANLYFDVGRVEEEEDEEP